ncbi:hypothetical protein KDAU_35710 [Dictyobacter aurantiacus]|uniref:Uncharacterized protein n=1 Tax=Dictyobacter aurantiacus TaxID=1936993 RepID=A0A401ZHB9_9CHLR|nr:hypothetical protein KDAU_35710 [Dictyobacter aurantiacus]
MKKAILARDGQKYVWEGAAGLLFAAHAHSYGQPGVVMHEKESGILHVARSFLSARLFGPAAGYNYRICQA